MRQIALLLAVAIPCVTLLAGRVALAERPPLQEMPPGPGDQPTDQPLPGRPPVPQPYATQPYATQPYVAQPYPPQPSGAAAPGLLAPSWQPSAGTSATVLPPPANGQPPAGTAQGVPGPAPGNQDGILGNQDGILSGDQGQPQAAPPASYGQMPPGQIPPGQASYGQGSEGQNPEDQSPDGQTQEGQMQNDQNSDGQPRNGQPPDGQAVDNPSAPAENQPIAPAPPLWPNQWVPATTARITALDKVGAQATTLTVPVGRPVLFGSLTITVKACDVRPPDQPQDATAFLAVTDSHPDEPGFDGWMLANEPSVSMMQNPLYDLRVAGCA